MLLLHALDAQKIDVEKEFFAYVKRAGKRALTVDHAKFTIINYTRWLKESKRTNDCGKYVKVAGQTSPAEVSGGKDVGGAWHWFFNETNCKAAADFTTTRLTNERAPNRTAACSTLGRIGSSEKHIAKMQIIVDTDPAYKEEVRDGSKVKVYYVRDACKAGIGKIKLRMP